MKELDQLKEQVFSLKNTGENLKEILCVVGGLPTMDGNGNNTFLSEDEGGSRTHTGSLSRD